MKSVIKIYNIESQKDVNLIQSRISQLYGVIASQISLSKKELTIIYNETCLSIETIIDSVEELGFVVI